MDQDRERLIYTATLSLFQVREKADVAIGNAINTALIEMSKQLGGGVRLHGASASTIGTDVVLILIVETSNLMKSDNGGVKTEVATS